RAAGAPAQAARCYGQAFGPEPSPEQWLTLAQAHWQAQELDQAAQAAQKAQAGRPRAATLAFLAEMRLRQRQYGEAARLYQQAAAQTEGDQAARWAMNAGYCHLRLHRLEPAAQAFAQAGRQAKPGGENARLAAKLLEQVRAQMAAAQP
ncbi:MAG: tetratricopeptide repeat protein, partial [Pseudomonadota bacterium]